ncbi:hypothetical protein CCR94_09945 [Rhodoblastus sphagnicola]|uniref:Uncharacterized protein n=1 Tax=Rhodoblastus sphagnicola TaxID=333368 RepID=A0A2S6N994_9HYPH|nr:hypothetical protein [Rhodoblastus sphagnicola]MBB4196527.1 cellulase/cellobiase CelA1 [Rhodoblastus sphagnicola]PPQ31188.1 hypothetical protein CCR94_09945 [Rhodoblastus sphagnicola]
MAKIIGIAELTSAVEKAVASVKLKPGPITVGFVAPEIDDRDATIFAHEAAGSAGATTAESGRKFVMPTSDIVVRLVH